MNNINAPFGTLALEEYQNENVEYIRPIDEGFCEMPKQTVTSFHPPPNHTQTVFVTAIYYDGEGDRKFLAQNAPFQASQSLIVTSAGGIVDAKDRNSPWVARDGKNHEPCTVCKNLSKVCSHCLVEIKLAEIEESIEIIINCQLSKSLIQIIEDVKQNKAAAKKQEVRDVIKEVEQLAMEYWELEANTKGVVKNLKVYGLSVKEAAEDYKEGGIHNDLKKELVNLGDVKDTLYSTNKNQDDINRKVKEIQRTAQKKSDEFGKKASMADG